MLQDAEKQRQLAEKMAQIGNIEDAQQAQQAQQQILAEIEEREHNILNPDEIKERYKNYMTSKEKAMNKLMKQFIINQRVKHKKNIGMYHAVVAALEPVRVDMIAGQPEIEVLNPLGVVYHKSPEIEWIQDGDYVAYKREMTVADIKKVYGDYLSAKDIKELEVYQGFVYGLDAKHHSRDGESPSHFHQRNRNRFGNGTTSEVLHTGSHGAGTSYDKEMCTVVDCYWITERYVGLYIYTDQFGEEQAEFVDGQFPIPKEATKQTVTDELGITKTYYEWENESGYQRLYFTWIPELWRGSKINDTIYCRIEPMPEAFQATPENPKDVKLPIYGATYNNINAPFVSTVDRMMSWYKLYLILMSKLLAHISTDYGVWAGINTAFIGDKIGVKETLQYAVKMRLLPYNPFQNAEAGIVGQMKPAESINLSNMANIKYYAELLEFIEKKIFQAAGVPKERLGETATNTNVSDNRQDLMQSTHITEPLFYVHDLIWEDVLNAAVVLVANSADKNHPFVRDILSDDEIEIIESGLIDKNTRFRLRIANNAEGTRIKQITEQHLHALIQNEKANLSTFLKILRKGDLTADIIQEIELIEKQQQQAEDNLQQRQLQIQQQQLEVQQQMAERKHEQEKELKQMEIDSKERIAAMDVYKFQQELDVDRNGIPDPQEAYIETRKLQQKDREIDIKQRQVAAQEKAAKIKQSESKK